MDLYSELYKLPKVELHRHLEGSVRFDTIIELSKEYNIRLPELPLSELKKYALVTEPMNNLKEVLDRFELARSCFINSDTIEYITYKTCIDAHSENIKLLEIRYSPDFIAQPFGHNFDMIMESIKKGINKAVQETGIVIGLIIVCSRDLGIESAARTIDYAISCKDDIIGIDLAGDESWGPGLFTDVFKKALKHGIKITAHSAEAINPEDVITCTESLGALRIGHGVQIRHRPNIMKAVADKGIHIEVNPTSNYITRSVKSIEDHPARLFFDNGIKISINSDDPGLFDINLTLEYMNCIEKMGFTQNEIQQTITDSLEASFIPEQIKHILKRNFFS